MTDKRIRSVGESARRVLDYYGHVETSDSQRRVYTDGDLNIGSESGVVEIIHRGSLVFRYGPDCAPDECVFEEHGDWASVVERLAESIPNSPREAGG